MLQEEEMIEGGSLKDIGTGHSGEEEISHRKKRKISHDRS